MRRLGAVVLATALTALVGAQEARADSVTIMGATLPSPRYGTSAVSDGQNAFIFGGHDPSRHNQIVRYNPSTDRAPWSSAAGVHRTWRVFVNG